MCNCKKNKCGCQKEKDDCNWGNEICKIKHKLCEIKKCLSCECSTPIFNKDLPLVITEPGCYCIAEDLLFNPPFNPIAPATPTAPYDYLAPTAVQAAITVLASNVQINFGCHILKQFIDPENPKSQIPYVIGIVVPDTLPNDPNINSVGLESVYISGDTGIISDFSMYGIRVFAHTRDIKIKGITIKNTAKLASRDGRPLPVATYGFDYLPHQVGDIASFGPAFGVAALAIGESGANGMGPVFFANISASVPSNRVTQVDLENVTCLNSFYEGMHVVNITNITMNDCHVDFNWSDDPGRVASPGVPAYGTLLPTNRFGSGPDNIGIGTDVTILNMVVNNCTFNSTQFPPPGTPGEFVTPMTSGGLNMPFGAGFVNAVNVVFNNCQFCSHLCTFPNGSFSQCALFVGCEDMTWYNCNFDNITSVGTIQAYHHSGNGGGTTKQNKATRLTNCTASNHRVIATQILPAPTVSAISFTGFLWAFANGQIMDNCTVQNNIVYSPSPAGFTSVGYSITGFDAVPPAQDSTAANMVLRGCVSSGNLTTLGGLSTGVAVGRGVVVDAIRSLIFENCIATGNLAMSPGLPPVWTQRSYALSDTVSFGNQNYISLIPGNVNSPGVAPGDWGITKANVDPWNIATTYPAGAVITYNGVLYVNVTNYAVGTASQTGTVVTGVGTAFTAGMIGGTITFLTTNVVSTIVAPFISGTQLNVTPSRTVASQPYIISFSSTGNQPDISPSNWFALPVVVSAWSSATVYSIGNVVSYLGYNYYSLINANTNNIPDAIATAWATYPGRAAPESPIFGIKDWSGSLVYNTGSVVIAAGIIYVSLAALNVTIPGTDLTKWTPYNISLTGSVHQGGGFGFLVRDNPQTTPAQFASFPTIFKGCIATNNLGLPVFNSTTTVPATFNPVYSAGYYDFNDVRTSFEDCSALNNIYGFFLKRCNRNTIRECRSDNNIDLQYVLTNATPALPYVGEGFTDVGTAGVPALKLGTPASPGVSTSLFENNTAYMNGNSPVAGPSVGTNLNYNVFVDPATALVPLPTLRGVISTSSYSIHNTSLLTIWTPNLNISNVQ